MLENKSRTELSTLGEFGLIDHLTQHFTNTQINNKRHNSIIE